MNGKAKMLALVVTLMAVAFAAGWLVARVGDVNKRDIGEITANRWMGDLGLLVDNARHLAPIDPKTTQSIIRQGLDIDSATLAKLYDGLSPVLRKRLVFYIPMARAIAVSQTAPGQKMHYTGALLTFAECMQQVKSQGGSVGECFDRHRAEK